MGTQSTRMVIVFAGGRYFPKLVRDDEDFSLYELMYPSLLRIEEADGERIWPLDPTRARISPIDDNTDRKTP